MLRKVFTSYEPKQVSAITTSTADHIPSIDTLSGTISFAAEDGGNDLHGTVSLSFACTYVKYELEVAGDEGSVLLQRKLKVGDPGYIVTITDKNGQERLREDYKYAGIENEFIAFANACNSRRDNNDGNENVEDDFGDCNTPLEAMRDIELVEAFLESGKENGKPILLLERDH